MVDVDPLDEVIAAYELESKAKAEHQAKLNLASSVLLDRWAGAMRDIIEEMNPRLGTYRCWLGFVEPMPSSIADTAAGATVTVRPHPESIRPALKPLTFMLESDGTVTSKVPWNDLIKAKSLEIGPAVPIATLRRILAQYVAYCLRH